MSRNVHERLEDPAESENEDRDESEDCQVGPHALAIIIYRSRNPLSRKFDYIVGHRAAAERLSKQVAKFPSTPSYHPNHRSATAKRCLGHQEENRMVRTLLLAAGMMLMHWLFLLDQHLGFRRQSIHASER